MQFPPIDPNTHYSPTAPELGVLGKVQTLAKWRHENRGPSFVKCGHRVVYKGADVLEWLESQRVQTAA